MKKHIQMLALLMFAGNANVMAMEGPQPRTRERLEDYFFAHQGELKKPGFDMTHYGGGDYKGAPFIRFDYTGIQNGKPSVHIITLRYTATGDIEEKEDLFATENGSAGIDGIAKKLDVKAPPKPSHCTIS